MGECERNMTIQEEDENALVGVTDVYDPSDEITAEQDKPDAKSKGGYKATIISKVNQVTTKVSPVASKGLDHLTSAIKWGFIPLVIGLGMRGSGKSIIETCGERKLTAYEPDMSSCRNPSPTVAYNHILRSIDSSNYTSDFALPCFA